MKKGKTKRNPTLTMKVNRKLEFGAKKNETRVTSDDSRSEGLRNSRKCIKQKYDLSNSNQNRMSLPKRTSKKKGKNCSLMHVTLSFLDLEGLEIGRKRKSRFFFSLRPKKKKDSRTGAFPGFCSREYEPLPCHQSYQVIASFCHMSYEGDMKLFTDVPSAPVQHDSHHHSRQSVSVTWKKDGLIPIKDSASSSSSPSPSNNILFPQILFRNNARNSNKTVSNDIPDNSSESPYLPRTIVVGLGIMGRGEVQTLGFVEIVLNGEMHDAVLSIPVIPAPSAKTTPKKEKKKKLFGRKQVDYHVIPLSGDDEYVCFEKATFRVRLSVSSCPPKKQKETTINARSRPTDPIDDNDDDDDADMNRRKHPSKNGLLNRRSNASFRTSNYTLFNLLPNDDEKTQESNSTISGHTPIRQDPYLMNRRAQLLHNQHSSRRRLSSHEEDPLATPLHNWDPFLLLEENSSPSIHALDLASMRSSTRSFMDNTVSSYDSHSLNKSSRNFCMLDGASEMSSSLDIVSSFRMALQEQRDERQP